MYVSHCILIVLISFAIGSIPVGVLLAKAFGLADPRTIGSGNIGATNMLRTGNKKVALLTLLLDAGKGIAAVMLASVVAPLWVFDTNRAAVDGCGMAPTLENCHLAVLNPHLGALALLVALAGHCYTPWLKGKGGKGVATALGGAFALSWPVGVAFCCAWLLVFLFTRYVSLASIAALVAVPLVAWLRLDAASALILAAATLIVIWRHRENLKRLHAGTEPKMMGKKDA